MPIFLKDPVALKQSQEPNSSMSPLRWTQKTWFKWGNMKLKNWRSMLFPMLLQHFISTWSIFTALYMPSQRLSLWCLMKFFEREAEPCVKICWWLKPSQGTLFFRTNKSRTLRNSIEVISLIPKHILEEKFNVWDQEFIGPTLKLISLSIPKPFKS